jgi:hypothetical protein
MPPSHQPHQHPHPLGHRPGPHAARWLHNSEGELDLSQVAALLAGISESVAQHGAVELGDLTVTLPPSVYSIVRHEIAPHGEKVIRVELKWLDDATSAPLSPITALLP